MKRIVGDRDTLSSDASDLWFTETLAHVDDEEPGATPPRAAASVVPEPALVPSDTWYSSQWHLHGAWGINAQPVWDDYTGQGIRVAVYDDGIDWNHYDLASRVDQSLSLDAVRLTQGGYPVEANDFHGTSVAGLVAGARNGIGVVGAAFDATLVSIYQGYSLENFGNDAAAFAHARVLADVMNNSWGYGASGVFYDNFDSNFAGAGAALVSAAQLGRNGLGTNIVFAGGNDRTAGDNTNYHNFQNDRRVITVAASDENGSIAWFSSPGTSLLVTAPGVNTVTTDRVGFAGYTSNEIYTQFGGTSAAAPIVSGVIALMLDANPNLGYRDVQEILAYSAKRSSGGSYRYNGGTSWNGAGLQFSDDFGAGIVDARAAVRLAETWSRQSTAHNEYSVTLSAAPNAVIPDLGTIGVSLANFAPIDIDHVELRVNMDHTWFGDLTITLISPSGMSSVLASRPAYNGTTLSWKFDSTQFWGETGVGTWSLSISDNAARDSGVLRSWSLSLYGDVPAVNDIYVYTDEFSEMFGLDPAHAAQRATLNDTDGGTDLFNGAALSDNAVIRLDGATSTVDGRAFTIVNNVIENAYGGDGNDTLIGSAGANVLYGARGNDRLEGGSGVDALYGGAGNDTFHGGADGDSMLGGLGNDVYRFDSAFAVADETSAGSGGTDTILIATTDFFRIPDGIEATLIEGGAIFATGGASAELWDGAATNDRIDGAGGGDTLRGFGGNDALIGGSGDDRLEGGAGIDSLYGGFGNDTYVVESVSDRAVERALESLYAQNRITGDVAWWTAGFTGLGTQVAIGRPGAGWLLAGRADLNGDGLADHLFRNVDTGENLVWFLDGANVTTGASDLSIPVADPSWSIGGIADFNGDGKADILWRNQSLGLTSLWQMDGVTVTGQTLLSIPVGSEWQIAGVADFNGDGKADILWRHPTGGLASIWLMDGATPLALSQPQGASAPIGWEVGAVGDITGDGKADIEWRHSSGATSLWRMDGATVLFAREAAWALPGSDWYTALPGAADGRDLVESSVDYSLGVGVEDLTLTGSAIVGTGNAGHNLLTGNGLANTLIGGFGNDTLDAGGGDDNLFGGGGSDVFYGGSGTDTVSFADASARIVVDLGTGTARSDGDLDQLISIEMVIGSSFHDTLIGSIGDDRVSGGAGNDRFVLRPSDAGNDTVLDFAAGDRIDVAAFGYTNIADLQIAGGSMVQSGTDVLLSLPAGAPLSLRLLGASLASMTADRFVFSDTGPGGTVIEADGAISLIARADRYVFDGASGPDATLKYLGTDVTTGQFGTWAPIGVEASAGSGYDVVWKLAGVEQYVAWHTDSNGDYVSSLTTIVAGDDEALRILEIFFDQDLNDDGITGVVLTAVESSGSTELSTGAGRYFFEIGGTPVTTLKYLGTDVVAAQFGDWAPIGAEASAGGGYDVVWKMAGVEQYVAWHTDNGGNYVSSLTGIVSDTDSTLRILENLLDQDLNDDGTLGVPLIGIESNGATGLGIGEGHYFFGSGGSPDTTLKYLGTSFVAGQFGDWAPIAVEASSGGYDVVWRMGLADQYTAWHTDSNGNHDSSLLGVVPGSDVALHIMENRFAQDLNGDGTLGIALTNIETAGSIGLSTAAQRYLFEAGGIAAATLKYAGADVITGQFGDWTPIGVEASAGGGYDVVWRMGVADQYIVWHTDSSGNHTASLTGVVAGSNTTVRLLENFFAQDFNGDGTLGITLTEIEADGATGLSTGMGRYFFDNSGAPDTTLKYLGADFVATQLGTWKPIAVEASGGGYDVVWKATDADQYTAWHTDGSGNYAASPIGVVSGSDPALQALETDFDQDLNGNGFIG